MKLLWLSLCGCVVSIATLGAKMDIQVYLGWLESIRALKTARSEKVAGGSMTYVRRTAMGLALVIACILAITLPAAQGQTFKVLYNFTGEQDGASPMVGLTMDKAGNNLYGTAFGGGYTGGDCSGGCGTVYSLSRADNQWSFALLYEFRGGHDGAYPQARVVFGPNGNLYGTTLAGGGGACRTNLDGCGTIFVIRPPVSICKTAFCSWNETVLHSFAGGNDGEYPLGDLIFDKTGDMYGATIGGGGTACSPYEGCGTAFELAPSGGGKWTESIIYRFTGGQDGISPGGLVLDNSGNLYGTGDGGGANNDGTIFRLTPALSGWTETTLYSFDPKDGEYPEAVPILDDMGNLYGATFEGGCCYSPVVYELSPQNGSWIFHALYNFPPGSLGPDESLTMDKAGNLYGTTPAGGVYDEGTVFKLTPSGGTWIYTRLHDFTGGTDGGAPFGSIILDSDGNLYGTAEWGGTSSNCGGGCGVVWEITQ